MFSKYNTRDEFDRTECEPDMEGCKKSISNDLSSPSSVPLLSTSKSLPEDQPAAAAAASKEIAADKQRNTILETVTSTINDIYNAMLTFETFAHNFFFHIMTSYGKFFAFITVIAITVMVTCSILLSFYRLVYGFGYLAGYEHKHSDACWENVEAQIRNVTQLLNSYYAQDV